MISKKAKLKFTKLTATGNDFILFDNRECKFLGNEHEFFRRICQRRLSVGADGVLLLDTSDHYHFSMRYFNSDGSLGEMCGNGARASAFYAVAKNIAPTEVNFDVLRVPYRATVRDQKVTLYLPPPVEIKENPQVVEEVEFEEGGYLNVGVPHYVLFVPNVEQLDVDKLGKKYRHHPAFFPWGANINFVQQIDDHTIKIRTYERGVEQETLACGTGTISAAILSHRQQGMSLPLTVLARGGLLTVNFDKKLTTISLEGEVRLVYSGELELQPS